MRILGIDPGLARVGYGVIDIQDGSSACSIAASSRPIPVAPMVIAWWRSLATCAS